MLLREIFDTKLDLPWQTHGRFALSSFNINNITYTIQIENRPLFKIDHKFKTAEVSFFLTNKKDDNMKVTTNDNKYALKIYSVVYNAIHDYVLQNEYDAIFFVAYRKHSNTDNEFKNKVNIYKKISQKLHGIFTNIEKKNVSDNGIGFLLSNINDE